MGGPFVAPAAREMEVELESEALVALETLVARPSFLHALESAASSFMPHRRSSKAMPSSSAADGPACGPTSRASSARVAPPEQLEEDEEQSHPLLEVPATPAASEQEGAHHQSTTAAAAASSPEHVEQASGPGQPAPGHEDDGWEAHGWDEAEPEEPDFVAVQREDALQALAYHIALCLAKHPEAQSMTPQQLQKALSGAFSTLKQTRFRRLCRVGRQVYRWSTLTYSALQFYQNPWIVQAVLTALWTFYRMGRIVVA